MKVVISGLSAPAELNGVSRHAANLVRGLLQAHDAPEIHFVAGDWQREMYTRAIGHADARLNFDWVTIRRRNFDRMCWYYNQLPAIAARLGADLVHLAYTMPVRRGAFRGPVVVSLHDLYAFDIPANFGRYKSAVNRLLVSQCLRNVSAIACVSASTQSRLLRWFGPEIHSKAVMIPNAIEPCGTNPARSPREVEDGQPFWLCVAQHRANKNIPLAVEVFWRMLKVGAVSGATKLVIVGIPGPETRKVRALIRNWRLRHNVILLSGIGEEELQWCYRRCELLLAPSITEGFGLPVAEALLAGCRVVCSDIPAFREIGGTGCWYVPFGAVVMPAYEAAIRAALSESKPRPVFLPELLPRHVGGRYMALYRQVLGVRPLDEISEDPVEAWL